MDSDVAVEHQIQAEIERLRAQFPETQDLYRETCVLLFFRFGITPTANRLYQFVRKGSMSAPTQALSKFWSDLREKSRVRIEHPDLPEELRTTAGDMLASLWSKAQAKADESLAVHRIEANAAILEAKQAQTNAEASRDAAQQKTTHTLDSLREASERVSILEQQLAAEGATRSALEAQNQQTARELARLQQAHEDARRDFAADLEKQRAAVQLAEERFRSAEERSLLEIDRERTAMARLRRELDQARAETSEKAERHRLEVATLQDEMGRLQQLNGLLDGSLQAAVSERDRLSVQTEGLRGQLTNALGEAAGLRVECDGWRNRAQEAQQAIAEFQVKATRRTKKPAP